MIRETIVNSEHTNAPACILSLDFQNAFDNISHTNLFKKLKPYGSRDTFRQTTVPVYEREIPCAYTCSDFKPHTNSKFHTPNSPLSMVPFAITFNPILHMLDDKLLQPRCGTRTFSTALITYANDVTIVLRNPAEIQQVCEVLHTYTATSGTRLNIGKSKALALGTCNTSNDVIRYHIPES
jgi:hypothetical protein